MLWELSVSEQRYRAVLEVMAGVPVTEVAERYGVSRQSVHTWLLRYRREGIAGLEDRSHRVRNHPWRTAAEVEELVCELRRGHPKWGPRRLVFEMGRRGRQVTRSSVYRALVRNGLVEPKSRRRRRARASRNHRHQCPARCQRPACGGSATAGDAGGAGQPAVEVDRVVPASGNVQLGGQQVWLGPALSGRQITVWVDAVSLHVLLDGARIKTLPSRLGTTELSRLAANGARPAGPSPRPAGDGAVIEVDRTVNATGLISLADQQVGVGSPLAGQRVTLRMEGPLMAVLGHDGTLLRTMACPVPVASRSRLRGARRARSLPPQPGGPITVQRRVSSRGGLMVARQKIHAGMIHAGKTAIVICENNHFRVVIDGETAAVVPRTTTSEVHRYKANATDKRTQPRLTPEGQ